MKIENIFVINLKDKSHRWEKFSQLHPTIDRFVAVDSREDYRVCEEYGLKLSPVAMADKLYFSQTSGSVGAYCSHYLIWKQIIKNNLNGVLILEDDAYTDDVEKLINENIEYDETYDLHQLNTRWHHDEYWHMNFDGLESYLLTNRGARILVDSTHNRDHFNGKVISGPFGKYKKSALEDCGLFNKTEAQDWSEKNIISCAVDKFVGFCANPFIHPSKRLRVKFIPKIHTFEQNTKSDIAIESIKPWHDCHEYELKNFLKSSYFEYWKYNLFLSPKHIPTARIKFSFLTTSMNRCADLKKTYLDNIKLGTSFFGKQCEFILLNYNSNDEMDEWVAHSNFGKYCNFKYLKTTKYQHFNMSVAKNIVGNNAVGSVLCWLDSDSKLTSDYVDKMNSVFEGKSSGQFLSVEYNKSNPGTCGRIACFREDYLEVGGYDESFEGWGYEDIDFTKRLQMISCKKVNIKSESIEKIDNSNINKFENYKNATPEKISEKSSFAGFRYSSNLQNFVKSQSKLLNNEFRANSRSHWGVI
jgi:GR25 family glycosyltransferase involved in LPS biosynthesis